MQSVNDKMLTSAALLFVGAILLALLIQWWLAPAYKVDNTVMHQHLASGELLVKPWQLKQLQAEGKLKNVDLLLLDGVSFDDNGLFGKKASVEKPELLSKQTLSFVDKSEKVFVLAGDEADALAAAWLLQSKGYSNVYALANNPEFLTKNVLNNYEPRWAQTTAEKEKYQYSRFFGSAGSQTRSTGNFAVPTGQPQVKKAAGGC